MRAAIIVLLLVAAVFAQATKCRVCDRPVEGRFYFAEDRAHGGKVEVCTNCANLESRCFACGLPVKSGFTSLKDGRFLCSRCAKEAVLDDEEAKKICLGTREELDRTYSRFFAFPATNVVLTIVDRFTLESLFKSPGHDRRCTSIFGATQSHALEGRSPVHTVSILSSLNPQRLAAVAAHEFGHTWLNENISAGRKAVLAPDAIEAFCELLAYQLMEERKEDFEKKNIRENPYTRGQLGVFLLAEQRHGFNAILDWLKSGEAAKLDADDPDGVRKVTVSDAESKPNPVNFTAPAAQPLPDSLALKSISGLAGRRFALINDRTFAVMDRAIVRLAKTNLVIRCLEIRTNSVLIRIENTGQKQELVLPPE